MALTPERNELANFFIRAITQPILEKKLVNKNPHHQSSPQKSFKAFVSTFVGLDVHKNRITLSEKWKTYV